MEGQTSVRGQRSRAKSDTIYTYAEACAGCDLCRQACSFVKTGRFGLADALIDVRRVPGKERYRIAFLKDCDGCGFCARYCMYGALSEVKSQ